LNAIFGLEGKGQAGHSIVNLVDFWLRRSQLEHIPHLTRGEKLRWAVTLVVHSFLIAWSTTLPVPQPEICSLQLRIYKLGAKISTTKYISLMYRRHVSSSCIVVMHRRRCNVFSALVRPTQPLPSYQQPAGASSGMVPCHIHSQILRLFVYGPLLLICNPYSALTCYHFHGRKVKAKGMICYNSIQMKRVFYVCSRNRRLDYPTT
jgi:hypothetical protein